VDPAEPPGLLGSNFFEKEPHYGFQVTRESVEDFDCPIGVGDNARGEQIGPLRDFEAFAV
jgi:hypothetical protein